MRLHVYISALAVDSREIELWKVWCRLHDGIFYITEVRTFDHHINSDYIINVDFYCHTISVGQDWLVIKFADDDSPETSIHVKPEQYAQLTIV